MPESAQRRQFWIERGGTFTGIFAQRPDGTLLTRSTPRSAQKELGTDADPVMLEAFNNLFMSIAEQMGGGARWKTPPTL